MNSGLSQRSDKLPILRFLLLSLLTAIAFLPLDGEEATASVNSSESRSEPCTQDYVAYEFPITVIPGDQEAPKVFGHLVAWQDYREVKFPYERVASNADIFLSGIFESSPTTPEKVLSQAGLIALSKHGLLYARSLGKGKGAEILLMDLKTGEISKLAAGLLGATGIGDDLVAWWDAKGLIRGVNLRTDAFFEFEGVSAPSGSSPQGAIRASTDLIVWSDRVLPSFSDYDIYTYTPSSGERRQISSHPALQTNPDVFGNIIVWQDLRRGNWDIFGYDLSVALEFSITMDPADQGSPAIWDNLVVWEDARDGGSDIYAYDLSTKTEFAVTRSHEARQPQIWQNVVVWTDRRHGNADIFGAVICLPRGLPLPSARFYTQASGQPPETGLGYAVTNEGGIPFWDESQRLGGVPALGYPVSQRFTYQGFTTQAFQKGVLQWQGQGSRVQGQVFLLNVFDELHEAGKDDLLLVTRATPRQLIPEFDAGKSWEEIVRDRLALLEANSAIRERYFSTLDPLLVYGLPTSRVEDLGNHYALRLQRAVLQQWKVEVPWARAGEVTVANGGDIAKETGLFPPEAMVPEAPP